MSNSPSTYWLHRPSLWRAAANGSLIQRSCMNCRKSVTYLATDLVQVLNPQAAIGQIWGECPYCQSVVNYRERERYPAHDDVGHLVVRRLKGFRQTAIWGDELYEPPPDQVEGAGEKPAPD